MFRRMATIDLARLPQLPLAFMNADHAREARLVNDVEAALDAHRRGEGTLGGVVETLSLLAVHTREHFMREETAMREARFPAYLVHKAAHDRVLEEMDAEARAFRDSGDGERLSRYLADALPAWFANHVRTMDTVTAAFLGRPRAATPAR
jgi:hemerythrin